MPLYEYECRDCGRRFEAYVVRSTDRPVCPGCSSENLEKQLSTFGVSGGSSANANCPLPGGAASCGSGGGG